MSKKQTGGSREGAGRPRKLKGKAERRNVYATTSDLAYAENLGRGNLSEGFRKLIEYHKNMQSILAHNTPAHNTGERKR